MVSYQSLREGQAWNVSLPVALARVFTIRSCRTTLGVEVRVKRLTEEIIEIILRVEGLGEVIVCSEVANLLGASVTVVLTAYMIGNKVYH